MQQKIKNSKILFFTRETTKLSHDPNSSSKGAVRAITTGFVIRRYTSKEETVVDNSQPQPPEYTLLSKKSYFDSAYDSNKFEKDYGNYFVDPSQNHE